MKKKKAKKRLLELIEKLQKNFPVSENVHLYMKCMRNRLGRTIYSEKKNYQIYINPSSDYEHQVDILMHEWAHIRVIDEMIHNDHGAAWGIELAGIYKSIHHDFRKKIK